MLNWPEMERCGSQWNAVKPVRGMLCAMLKVIWNLKHHEMGEPIKEEDFMTGRPATPQ